MHARGDRLAADLVRGLPLLGGSVGLTEPVPVIPPGESADVGCAGVEAGNEIRGDREPLTVSVRTELQQGRRAQAATLYSGDDVVQAYVLVGRVPVGFTLRHQERD